MYFRTKIILPWHLKCYKLHCRLYTCKTDLDTCAGSEQSQINSIICCHLMETVLQKKTQKTNEHWSYYAESALCQFRLLLLLKLSEDFDVNSIKLFGSAFFKTDFLKCPTTE